VIRSKRHTAQCSAVLAFKEDYFEETSFCFPKLFESQMPLSQINLQPPDIFFALGDTLF